MRSWQLWTEVNCKRLMTGVPIAKRAHGNPGGNKRDILALPAAFDVETSRIPELDQSFVYHWQMQIGFEDPTIYGRELWEFRAFMDNLAAEIPKDQTMLVFVHNLSYEFHFLRGVFPEILPEDVFSVKPRKPVKVKLYGGRIELRCSYILTNMGLGLWTKKMGVEHQKLDGDDFDYNRLRWPWTELSPLEKEYCRNDVLGLCEALQRQLDVYGDTEATLVLTSTGYVRRDVKRVMKQWSWRGLQALQPSAQVYLALREAFRGGNTHANRFYAGYIVEDAGSMDRSSSYPDVCCNRPFPMGKFQRSIRQTESWMRYLIREGRAVLVRFKVEGLRLKDKWTPCPYISYSKVRGVPYRECRCDNGRILEAPVAEMTITDLDLDIIERQYTWDSFEILDMWDSRYSDLPGVLRSLIIKYYQDKTSLKGVKGQEMFYDKAKALLNSIYGLQAQDPCKPDTVYNPDPGPKDDLFIIQEGDIEAKLLKSRKQPYTGYQIGVWVCAWARWELQVAIDAAGDQFLYADTDSVKFVGNLDLTEYNREKVRNSTASGAWADDPAGVRHYMGVFEDEGRYKRFITMGAKKYAYEDSSGKLHLTLAGVGKKEGAAELAAAGGLEAFKPGFIFQKAGGTEAIYNDRANVHLIQDGHELNIGPNVCLRPSTYKLGYADDYADLLKDVATWDKLDHEHNLRQVLLRMEDD